MTRRISLALFLVLLFMSIAPMLAQTDAPYEWELLLYDGTHIVVFSVNGPQHSIDLPEEAHNLRLTYSIMLSPDRHWLVFPQLLNERTSTGMPLAQLIIADLHNHTCCVVVENQSDIYADTLVAGTFSPDNSQFTFSTAQRYSDFRSTSFSVFDALTGEIVTTLPMDDDTIILSPSWTEDGILYFQWCWTCERQLDEYYNLWNPENGAITDNVQYFNALGDTLPLTGETIRPARDEDYPVSEHDDMLPFANVVHYLPENTPGDGVVVYNNPDEVSLSNPHWVMDGNAFLVNDWDTGSHHLVFRDGRVMPLALTLDDYFVAGTPDGWVMQRMADGKLFHYTMQDGELLLDDWVLVDMYPAVLEKPELGANVIGVFGTYR